MAGLFLLEVALSPSDNVAQVSEDALRALLKGLADSGGKRHQLFQVSGENKLITVFEGNAHLVSKEINQAVGAHVHLKCTPLRPYENFARYCGVLEEALLEPKRTLGRDGIIFWFHCKIEYQDLKSLDKLLTLWKLDAEAALSVRLTGQADLDIYKVPAQREIHGFACVGSADDFDDFIMELPLVRQLGHNMHFTCKAVTHVEETLLQTD